MKCKKCYIGRYQVTKLPYITPLDAQIMVVPNASAYQCDACKNVIFNEAFLDRLHYLLDNLTHTEMSQETAERYALSEQLINWQPSGRNS